MSTEPVSILSHRSDVENSQPLDLAAGRAAPLSNDVWIYRFAIFTLGALSLLSLGGAMLLTAFGHDAPQVTVALGSAAVGALAGLLTPALPRQ
jgi:hypothetical protein